MDGRVIAEQYLGLAVGAALVLLGLIMVVSHRRSWKKQQHDAEISDLDLGYYNRRYYRRLQTSGLLILIGILIAVGDTVIAWREAPGMFVAYWGLVLALAVWVILLALADLAATNHHSRTAIRAARQRHEELRAEIARLTASRSRNQDSQSDTAR